METANAVMTVSKIAATPTACPDRLGGAAPAPAIATTRGPIKASSNARNDQTEKRLSMISHDPGAERRAAVVFAYSASDPIATSRRAATCATGLSGFLSLSAAPPALQKRTL